MGLQSAVASFFEGPNGESNKKLLTNVCVFGVAVLVLHHWETVIGPIDGDVPAQ
eukprot:CAMPEP_0206253454 /NCGR_PEP_ID=MMETSP0047_2-20121206/23158_1 /ASSEMBLY_ACC=CAM_ASM_000192 /TAXON_ID=195065 /ORGANISM="Chroomonas mesostigmatica_cf, Strain CCMP1168" /LENGTH=53 /DNA_ID=CAMNT_0053679659 /DNA_START=12 /DNA_END=173 /DNA_ORIENTATION=+